MTILDFPAPAISPSPQRAGESGDFSGAVAALDSSTSAIYLMNVACPDCGGVKIFYPVERFPHGWRGYCLGCEREKYVLFERTSEQ